MTILHGFLGAGGNWHTLSRSVFGEHFRVLVPDLRNHGQSPHDSRMDYEAMAEDILAMWDEHGVEQGLLMGHSMGGKLAMQVALTAPERVSKLVVVDIAPRTYPPGHLVILEALRRADPASRGGRDEVDAVLAETIPDLGVRQFLLKNLRRTEAGFDWLPNLDVLESSYDQLIGGLHVFATYEGPTLVVRGERSDYVQDDDMDVLRAYCPQAELVTIADAGHWVHAEQPEAFSDAVMGFVLE